MMKFDALRRPALLLAFTISGAALTATAGSLSCQASGPGPYVSCTLKPSPLTTAVNTSHISFVATSAGCTLLFVQLQDKYPGLDVLPINPIATTSYGQQWNSGGGPYATVFEVGETPTVTAVFSCPFSSTPTSSLWVTVRY
jgi:hypothetical protein